MINLNGLTFENYVNNFSNINNKPLVANELIQFLLGMALTNNPMNFNAMILGDSFVSNNKQVSKNNTLPSSTKIAPTTRNHSYRNVNIPYNGESYAEWKAKINEHQSRDPGFSDVNDRQGWVNEGYSLSLTEACLREGTARMKQIVRQGITTPVLNSVLQENGYEMGGLTANHFVPKANILGDQVKSQVDKLLSEADEAVLNNPAVVAALQAYQNQIKLFDDKVKEAEEHRQNFVQIREDSLANNQWAERHNEQCAAADATRVAMGEATNALKESAQAAIDLENAISDAQNATTPEEAANAQVQINKAQNNLEQKEEAAEQAQENNIIAQQAESQVIQTQTETTPTETTPTEAAPAEATSAEA